MGHGYKGDTGHYHSFSENVSMLKTDYSFNESSGYFGSPGSSSSSKVREIASDDPLGTAKDFYDKAAHGGKESQLANGEGYITKMKDGSVLTFRPVSHSADKSPAVDINISSPDGNGGVKTQKIHFVLSKED